MILHTLTALGMPFLARLALSGAEKKGYLPAKHYLKCAVEALGEQRFEAALAQLKLAFKGGKFPAAGPAVVDLLRMKIDQALHQRKQTLKTLVSKIQQLERAQRHLITRTKLRHNILTHAYIYMPSAIAILVLSAFLGVVAGLSTQFDAPALPVLIIVASALLLSFAQLEARRIRHRKIAVSAKRAANRYQRDKIAGTRVQLQQEVAELQRECQTLENIKERAEQLLRERKANVHQRQPLHSEDRGRFCAFLFGIKSKLAKTQNEMAPCKEKNLSI